MTTPDTGTHGSGSGTAARSIGAAVLIAIATLVLVECLFQVRAQLRTGESVFTLLQGKTTYVKHPRLDVRTLRPSSVIEGSAQTIASNRYGLRDQDFDPVAPVGEVRIALLGASTIMGAYASTNEQTSSAALERLLNRVTQPAGQIRVVNAGLGGTTVQEQTTILQGLLPDLGVRQVIWYPGSNDIGCEAPPKAKVAPQVRAPWPALPSWVLTGDILVKNTAFLRRSNAAFSQVLRPNFNQAAMFNELERGVVAAKNAGLSIVLVTIATSFRSDMPPEMATQRAANSLFFRPCYSGPELAAAVDGLNAALREVARAEDVSLIDAARLIPPDLSLFGDASHFSAAGEEAFAAVLAGELERQGLLPGRPLP